MLDGRGKTVALDEKIDSFTPVTEKEHSKLP